MFPQLAADDKHAAIDAFVEQLAAAHGVVEIDPLLESVRQRERKDATGLEMGVAVPHGKTDAVDSLMAGLATLAQPLDFGARDGQASRILVMTISPQRRSGPHLQFIAEVVRLLRDASLRESLLAATTGEQLYEAFIR